MPRAAVVPMLLAGFVVTVVFWWLLGHEQEVPGELRAGQRVQCVSYTPFSATENPTAFRVERSRLEHDFSLLASYAACVRLYSTLGMELVPEVARAHGMTVIAGAWVGRDAAMTERELTGVIALANRHPDVVRAVVVGNEVLLRRERTVGQLLLMLQRVRAAVSQPVSYADVWDFWRRNPLLAAGVDFVTIHLLPYWDDHPGDAAAAIAKVRDAHEQAARMFPDREILIGETGWPSEGRQRGAAVPSRVNEARFVRAIVQHAESARWSYNLIEAFDQPWKRAQEGAVGGYWGLFDAGRHDKRVLRGMVSDLPQWRVWCGVAAVLWLGGLWLLRGSGGWSAMLIVLVAANATALHLQQQLLYSRTAFETAWSLMLAVMGCLAAWSACRRLGGHAGAGWHDGVIGVTTALAAIEMLELCFDARYRHFPIAAFAVPAVAAWLCAPREGPWHERCRVLAVVLLLCAPALLWQESLHNTQALVWGALMTLMAGGLLREGSSHRGGPTGALHADRTA